MYFMIEINRDFPENGVQMLIDLFKEKQKQRNGNLNPNIISSWRNLFSKPEEHQIEREHRLAVIREPCKQWRITLDFKPSSYYTSSYYYTLCFSPTAASGRVMDIGFSTTSTNVVYSS